MRVHKGTSVNGLGEERPCAWVETSIKLEPEANDLIYGLGSKYFRYETPEDDERDSDRPESLPSELTQAQIVKIYREERDYWGRESLSTWVDGLSEDRFGFATKWLTELVVGAFPEMKEYVLR